MSTEEISALFQGCHVDPHHILGPHYEADHLVVRTLQPNAEHVIVRALGIEAHAQRHTGDLFEAVIAVDPHDIAWPVVSAFEVHHRDGGRLVELDPYAFSPSIGDLDLYLIGDGRHEHLDDVLGARAHRDGSISGTAFSVWAPAAVGVALVGDFNGWNPQSHPMRVLGNSGVWELFVPRIDPDTHPHYKFAILNRDGVRHLHADPVAHAAEHPPNTASVVWSSTHEWNDGPWVADRADRRPWQEPLSVYEVHLGSWRQGLNYRELGEALSVHVNELGFTHVELLPVMEHPFAGSWGYQVTGFFAPTSRFGSPDDFAVFVDTLHRNGIGVIFDWVPAHFPRDTWALARFDGTALYEHEDARRGAHPDWGTLIFNHGRHEVRNFLLGSARRFLRDFHGDGLRVDAVASMLYLDYSRTADGWVPNIFGGREDLEALAFLRELNAVIHREFPGTIMAAEESTAWPGVTAPTSSGGLGFGFKWNMGWMHDTLEYFSKEPIHRQFHHDELTFSSIYAFSENFVLPLSHDEVVHGKRSLLDKMPGDRWQQFANLRALYGYMWAHPGKKLLFMGGEFAQSSEWNHEQSLDWHLLADERHAGVQRLVSDLNRLYRAHRELWEVDADSAGFSWIKADDAQSNVIAFERRSADQTTRLICAANLSPVPREHYVLDVAVAGTWQEILNTDSTFYGGSNIGNQGLLHTFDDAGPHPRLSVTLPPLGAIWLTPA